MSTSDCQYHRLQVSTRPGFHDARADATLKQLREFFDYPVTELRTRDVYSVFADVSALDAERLLAAITNPVTQTGRLGHDDAPDFDWVLIIGYLPGVTDNVARTARTAASDVLGRRLADHEAIYSSVEYLLAGTHLGREEVESIGNGLLANRLIQSVEVRSREQWLADGPPLNRPRFEGDARIVVATFDLTGDDDELHRLSSTRTLALSLDEMHAIRDYFLEAGANADRQAFGLGGEPTDVELEMLAQTWSEHCKHKIFDAVIDYTDAHGGSRRIESCYKSFIQQSTREIGERVDWLVSVFKDNAGVIAFNDDLLLVYKVETHNSPSALDPYGGAMTGIVGVNRDPLGTGIGADLLINVWGYCLASPFTPADDVPEGLLHPRRLRDGIHKGVIDGGNQSGIPYGIGWEYFDPRYVGKPLVFCGTVGTLPTQVNGKGGHEKSIRPGDLVVMAGGRIGKDGIHGATFSSEELHSESPVQAVQIGDPITQKQMSDFMYAARDAGLYSFVTDNGAGGLSSSIGESARVSGGARLDLAAAPLKYRGLQPWEIFLSEAQERMSFAVPPQNLDAFRSLAELYEVEVTVLGEFTDSGKFHVTYGDKTVAFIDLDFVHDGCPRMHLKAQWTPPQHPEPEALANELDPAEELLALMGRLNLASNEYKARQYDHEVKGISVVKPLVGVANDIPSDASVFMVAPGSPDGVILAAGVLPRYSDIDTYHMATSVLDLAVRRIIAVGGKLGRIAGLDNFCWPDPVRSDKTPDGEYKLAQLVRANQGLYDYATALNVPCISGKDSMKNDSTRGGEKISIPPTLLFSTIARMEDVSKAVTLDAKRVGDLVYVLGETRDELGGSELYAAHGYLGNRVPTVDMDAAKTLYQAVAAATEEELCHSVHTPALGGLAVAFAKVALGGRLGLTVDLAQVPRTEELDTISLLFSETNSRFIVTIPPHLQSRFEDVMDGVPAAWVGRVTYEPALTFFDGQALEFEVALGDLLEGYQETLNDL